MRIIGKKYDWAKELPIYQGEDDVGGHPSCPRSDSIEQCDHIALDVIPPGPNVSKRTVENNHFHCRVP